MKISTCWQNWMFTAALLTTGVGWAGDAESLTWTFDGAVDKTNVPYPWKLKTGSGRAQIEVRADPDSGKTGLLWLKADKASFFLGRNEREFDAADYPVIEWSWKGVTLPTGGDVRKSSLNPFADNRNDQALQLLVTFANGDVISYMWDTSAPVGTEIKENNPFANIMSVVVESGPDRLKKWLSYRRNIYDDYQRLHNKKVPKVVAIAVQTNANHTKSQSEGYFDVIVARRKK